MTKQFSTEGPRAIYPELCTSRSLGRCGLVANLIFPRLVAKADDQGRLHGDTSDLMIATVPRLLHRISAEEFAAAMAELEREGMVQRYTVKREEYVQLVGWWSRQGSMRRAYPSRHPAPRGWTDMLYGTPGMPASYADAVAKAGLEASLGPRGTRRAATRGDSRQSAAERGALPPTRARALPNRTEPNRTEPDQSGDNAPAGPASADAPSGGGGMAALGEVMAGLRNGSGGRRAIREGDKWLEAGTRLLASTVEPEP